MDDGLSSVRRDLQFKSLEIFFEMNALRRSGFVAFGGEADTKYVSSSNLNDCFAAKTSVQRSTSREARNRRDGAAHKPPRLRP